MKSQLLITISNVVSDVKIQQSRFQERLSKKSPSRFLGEMQKKNDFTQCATINDLIIMRGHETPENHPLTALKGFSTVSEGNVEERIVSSQVHTLR
jgi:hypothetical protein